MWLLLLVGFYVLGTVTRLERRRIASKYPGHNIPMMVLFFLLLIPVGIALSFFLDTNYSVITPGLMAYIFFGSAVWPLAGYMGYRANVLTGAGLFTILGSIAPIVAVILSVLLLGETVALLGVVGIALILGANILVVNKANDGSHPDILKGIILSLITGVIVGVGATFEKSVLDQMELGTYVVVGWGSQGFWVLVLAWLHRQQVVTFFIHERHIVKESMFFVFSGVTKSIFFLAALSIANASIVVPATNFIAVVVVVASYFFLHERDHIAQKLVAVVLGVTGLLLLGISS